VDFLRHDSGVRRHQGKTPDGFHHQGPDAPSAHRRPGYPLSGCVPAEPDSVSPSSVRLASTEQYGNRPSNTGVMPQKILLYRFSTEKRARSYPHALEKNQLFFVMVERTRDVRRLLLSPSGHRVTNTINGYLEPVRSALHVDYVRARMDRRGGHPFRLAPKTGTKSNLGKGSAE
jgi:hypothetical protein